MDECKVMNHFHQAPMHIQLTNSVNPSAKFLLVALAYTFFAMISPGDRNVYRTKVLMGHLSCERLSFSKQIDLVEGQCAGLKERLAKGRIWGLPFVITKITDQHMVKYISRTPGC